jgi:hypothetical protein
MGIPYSKQINQAFDQVTPLVAEGFKVLEKTKNIAVLLLWLEILSTTILALLLVFLIALLITVNPDLEEERRTIVTPVVKWITREAAKEFVLVKRYWVWALAAMISAYVSAAYLYYVYGQRGEEATRDGDEEREGEDSGDTSASKH